MSGSRYGLGVTDLQTIAGRKTARLTTVGRKSGQERTVEIWFVVDEGAVLVQAGPKGRKGWYANVGANPTVRLQIGDTALEGIAERLEVSEERDRVAALFRRKYWLARLAGWVGSPIGRGDPVRIRTGS